MAFQRFEELEAWQSARQLAHQIYEVSRQAEFAQDGDLRKQIRRSAVSIMSNIAEGFERNGSTKFCQYLTIARGSLGEVQSQLYVALDQQYLSDAAFRELMLQTDETGRCITGLSRDLRNADMKGTKYRAKPAGSQNPDATGSGPGIAPPHLKLNATDEFSDAPRPKPGKSLLKPPPLAPKPVAGNPKLDPRAPIDIAVAVVRSKNQFLVGTRPAGVPLAGMAEFPGGKVQVGETPPAAAVRECLEETGLEVRVVAAHAPVLHEYPHGALRLRFFECEPVADNLDAREPFRWVSFAELRRLEFPPANAGILRELSAREHFEISNSSATLAERHS